MPFSLKLLPGVLCDSISIPGYGRRKTWATIGHVLMAIALFLLYLKFDKWVESKAIMSVCLSKLLLYTGAAIQGEHI